MSDEAFGPVTFGGGARWNPTARSTDDSYMQVAHSVQDLVTVLRGAVPNMDLGPHADSFIFAGEWKLALDEIEAVMRERRDQSSDLADAMLARAKKIMQAAAADEETK